MEMKLQLWQTSGAMENQRLAREIQNMSPTCVTYGISRKRSQWELTSVTTVLYCWPCPVEVFTGLKKGTNICQDWTIGHFSLSDGHCVRLGNQRFRNSCHNRPDYTLDLFHMTDPRSLLHFSIFALMHKRVIGSPGQWRHRAHHHIKTRLASVIWDIKYSCAIFCSGASNICC